jgi:ribosome-associated protein
MEDPMIVRPGVEIPLSEFELRSTRSSGPGGQHANVTASRVVVTFDVEASRSLSPEQKRRVVERAGRRLRSVSQDSRSQARNRERALERMRERLATALRVERARRPTRPSRAAEERRLQQKRRRSERKRRRRPPQGED